MRSVHPKTVWKKTFIAHTIIVQNTICWGTCYSLIICRTSIHRKVPCRQWTVCNTFVFVTRGWVVGRDKHLTQYVVRIPAETSNGYVRSLLFTRSCEIPDTGRDARLTVRIISPINTTTKIYCQWHNPGDSSINTCTAYFATLWHIWRVFNILAATTYFLMLSHLLIFLKSSPWSENKLRWTSWWKKANKIIRAPQYQYAKGAVI